MGADPNLVNPSYDASVFRVRKLGNRLFVSQNNTAKLTTLQFLSTSLGRHLRLEKCKAIFYTMYNTKARKHYKLNVETMLQNWHKNIQLTVMFGNASFYKLALKKNSLYDLVYDQMNTPQSVKPNYG